MAIPIETLTDAELIITERMDMVPTLLTNILTESSLIDHIQQIIQKHKLPVESHALLENEIALVVLALEPRSALGENIAQSLKIPPQQGEEVAKDVYENVLKEVLEIIDTTYESLVDSQAIPTISTPMPSSPPVIPSYQKPLMGVPRYQSTPPAAPVSPQVHTVSPQSTPIPAPTLQPPVPPRM